VGSQNRVPASIPPKKSPGINCAECWVGRSGRAQISRPSAGFEPRTVQPVASRYYKDSATPSWVEAFRVMSPTQIAAIRCHHAPSPEKRLNIKLSLFLHLQYAPNYRQNYKNKLIIYKQVEQQEVARQITLLCRCQTLKAFKSVRPGDSKSFSSFHVMTEIWNTHVKVVLEYQVTDPHVTKTVIPATCLHTYHTKCNVFTKYCWMLFCTGKVMTRPTRH
jgi:hypothetical protein